MDLACCKTRRVLERLTNIRWGAENVGEQQGLCLKTIFTIVKFTRRIPMEVSKHTGCPVSPGGTLTYNLQDLLIANSSICCAVYMINDWFPSH
jgi:hypothetical protein